MTARDVWVRNWRLYQRYDYVNFPRLGRWHPVRNEEEHCKTHVARRSPRSVITFLSVESPTKILRRLLIPPTNGFSKERESASAVSPKRGRRRVTLGQPQPGDCAKNAGSIPPKST